MSLSASLVTLGKPALLPESRVLVKSDHDDKICSAILPHTYILLTVHTGPLCPGLLMFLPYVE